MERAKAASPDWENVVYSEERKRLYQEGKLSLRELHVISGPEMLRMALVGFRKYEQGKYSEAQTMFTGLIQLDPKQPYYFTALGAVFLAQEEFDQARQCFDRAIALDSKEVAPYVNRGEVNLREGKVHQAAEDFARAVELDPKGQDPLTQRARALATATLQMIERQRQAAKKPAAAPAAKAAPAKSAAPKKK